MRERESRRINQKGGGRDEVEVLNEKKSPQSLLEDSSESSFGRKGRENWG